MRSCRKRINKQTNEDKSSRGTTTRKKVMERHVFSGWEPVGCYGAFSERNCGAIISAVETDINSFSVLYCRDCPFRASPYTVA
jgi:hypothetical protein